MRRAAVLLLALGLAAVACTGDDEPAPRAGVATAPPEVPARIVEVVGATLTYPADPDTSAVATVRAVDFDGFEQAYVDAVDRDVPLAFALRACRVHSAARSSYDIQWRPPDGLELPVSVVVSVGSGSPYEFAVGIGTYEVELHRAGTFRIVQELDPQLGAGEISRDDEEKSAGAVRDDEHPRQCMLRVISELLIDDQTEADLGYRAAADLVEVDAPSGSLQSLAGSAHPVAPLVERFLVDLSPRFEWMPDRIWLHPDGDLFSLSVQERFGCWRVRSVYSDDALEAQDGGGVTVLQERGCAPGEYRWSSLDRVVSVKDSAWHVEVIGPPQDVDALVPGLRAVPVAGVEPLPDGLLAHDPVAEFDAQAEAAGWTIIGRLPWRDGEVVIWSADGEIDGEIETWAADGRGWFNAGGGGTPIQAGICVATLRSSRDDAGFAVIVYDDPAIARVEVEVEVENGEGQWEPVTIEANGAFRFAMIDADFRSVDGISGRAPAIRGFDADGEQIDCVRNQ